MNHSERPTGRIQRPNHQERSRIHAVLCELARSRGGNCLSAEYLNARTPMVWQCRNGHTWKASANNVKRGTWCPFETGRKPMLITELREFAGKKGGRCLSRQLHGAKAPLKWRCRHGHVFEKDWDHVVRRNQWCPCCNPRRQKTIADLQRLARERKGRCLSRKYLNAKSAVVWRCRARHTWKATANSVARGTWCPRCARNQRLTIHEMQQIAANKGGACRSHKYKNSSQKLRWQCRLGHRWAATPRSVKRGSWCPQCARGTRATIREARRIASARNGTCLSRVVHDSWTLLKWRCAAGHQWSAQYKNVKDGSWCPYCPGSAGEMLCRQIFERIFPGHHFPTATVRKLTWLRSSTGGAMHLDGYNQAMRVGFEYNGVQHERPDHFFYQSDPASFERRRSLDLEKLSLCVAHNVTLVIVPEFANLKAIDACESEVRRALASAGLQQQ